METNVSRRYLFITFGALYFVQGVIQAYQLNFFKPHMNSEGIDADQLAIVASLALLPFIIKWIYGIISDKYSLFGRGHRVPYMQIGLIATSVAFFGAYFVDPSANFAVLAAMVVTATFFMALFDTTADALAVDAVVPEDHSKVQAVMTGGRAAGLVIVSLIFGVIADTIGYQAIFIAIGALLLIPLFFVNRIREPKKRTPAHSFDRRAFKVLLQPRYLAFAVLLILAWTFFQGIDGTVTFYMSDTLESSGRTIGLYGTLKGIGMVIGALSLSFLVTRFGRRTAALVTVSLVSIGGLAFSTLTTEKAILTVAILWGIVVGLQWTTYVTLSMDITDTRIAASMFAILQTMANIGLGAGEGIATSLTDNIGFSGVFRSFGLLNLAVIPIVLFVTGRFAKMYARTTTDALAEEL